MAAPVGYNNLQEIYQSFQKESHNVKDTKSLKDLFAEALTLPPSDKLDIVLQSIAMRALKLEDSNLATDVAQKITNQFIRSQTLNPIVFALVDKKEDVNLNLFEEITDQREKNTCIANCVSLYLGYKRYEIAREVANLMVPGHQKDQMLSKINSLRPAEVKLL